MNCGNPLVISNGMSQFSATTFGETATYMCNGIFVLSGSSTTTCMASGLWSTPPICSRESIVIKDHNICIMYTAVCEDLPPPANGVISYDRMFFPRPAGTVATYTCDTGYDIFGRSTRTCQLDTTWSGGDTVCQGIFLYCLSL